MKLRHVPKARRKAQEADEGSQELEPEMGH